MFAHDRYCTKVMQATLICGVLAACTEANPDFTKLEVLADGGLISAGESNVGGGSAGEMSAGEMIPCINPQDCDGDGTLRNDDCDDEDPLVFPGAPELCDGIDNSCNGEIDEVVSSCYTGPEGTLGFGTCQAGIQRCINEMLSDCEMEVTPREERCDATLETGLDDDCDGRVDEGCDLDMDQVTVDEGDCNDRNPNISPNQPELCNGIDDNCNRQIDELMLNCYSGPDSTLNVGSCRGGMRRCVDDMLSECQGEITPTQEICGDEIDNDCDGEVDEGCNIDACSVINRNTPISLSTSCLTAGTFARGLIQVTPTLLNGDPLPDSVSLSLNTQPALTVNHAGQEGGTWYWEVVAPSAIGDVNVSIQVNCANDEQTTLIERPMIQVSSKIGLDQRVAPFAVGGCEEPKGNLYIEVFDAETHAQLPGASVLIGDAPNNGFQTEAAAFVRGEEGNSPNNFTVNSRGRMVIQDYDGALDEPLNITVGKEGYENLSLFGVEGGNITVHLRPLSHSGSGRPTPNQYELTGSVSDFNNLSNDGRTDLALVLPSLTLEALISKPITQLLSRFECWRPVRISPEVLIPGNLYVPGQNESFFRVSPHDYRIQDHDQAQDHVMALSGKIGTNEALVTLGGGGATASSLLSQVDFKEIGVRLNTNFSLQGSGAPVATQTIPLSANLNTSLASCAVSGVPSGAYASCISAGEWTVSGVGTGRVFPMGIINFPSSSLSNGASQRRAITHASLAGELSNIYYLSAALAIPDSNDESLRNATSSIIDRSTLGPTGGALNFTGFLGLVHNIARTDRTLSWSDVTAIGVTNVDACDVSLFVSERLSYSPGGCGAYQVRERHSPLWTSYLAGLATEITYPILPSTWPRSSSAGLIGLDELAMNEVITARIRCAHFDGSFNGSFTNMTWRDLVPTHVTSNQVRY